MNVYDFIVKTGSGEDKSLADYRGKVLLIVNLATKCGFTPQLKELQELYDTYKNRGFEILGFPSDQFANQSPGTHDEIMQFCKLNYGVTFPVFAKGDVRDETAQPLYKYLTEQTKFAGFDMSHPVAQPLVDVLNEEFPDYLKGDGIKWNFTKFLIDREGNIVARFEPTTLPSAIAKEIEKLL
ncbi:MAG: glutathione peroxidase [Selenomonadaceae bacterium]|nr:glutathione peroxidase [Selenomonadaceae bacterium]